MLSRENLQLWVRQALGALGGEGFIIDVVKRVWADHEEDIIEAGDAFYTWQYDIRWAADALRKSGHLGLKKAGSKSVWVLKK